jgi:hypothetical protein
MSQPSCLGVAALPPLGWSWSHELQPPLVGGSYTIYPFHWTWLCEMGMPPLEVVCIVTSSPGVASAFTYNPRVACMATPNRGVGLRGQTPCLGVAALPPLGWSWSHETPPLGVAMRVTHSADSLISPSIFWVFGIFLTF